MNPKHYLTIGDLHGRRTWYHAVTPWVLRSPDHVVIFLGDYVDSFTVPLVEQRDNLTEVLAFQQLYPEQVVLLLGNHDAHYLWPDAPRGSGFSVAGHAVLHPIFRENAACFRLAYQHDTPDGQHYLWTHAGVSNAWLEAVPPFDAPVPVATLADALNLMSEAGRLRPHLLTVGGARGGQGAGGPLWADAQELTHPLPGYHQIVGHTALLAGEPLVVVGNETTSVALCDYNEHAPTDEVVGPEWFYQLTLEL